MSCENLGHRPPGSIRWSISALRLLILTTAALLFGCDSNNNGIGSEEQGEIIIGLTDAEGDFLTYTAEILSLKLTRANGAEVETLPLATTVDFAQYAEVTEFLTVATVPAGTYISASMVADYSNANIVVQDENGAAKDAVVKDNQGNVLGRLEMDVQFARDNSFVIVPGIPAHITLDFDLETTHSIDLAQTPAEVVVDPVLIADTLLEDPKPHRLRGLLQTVNADKNVFSVRVRPFQRSSGLFGSLRVTTLDNTVYELDETAYTGKQGLDQLALMPPTTAIVVFGQLNISARKFEASEVYAGTSVPWGDKDLVTGHVVAREGDVLTLRGASVVRSNNSVVFNDEVKLTVGIDTRVTKQATIGERLDKNALSVGQRITAAGRLINTTPGNLQLDASEGHVRMLLTNLNGEVVQVTPLIVDLQSIDGRRIEIFDFSGTGSTEDADPARYEIDTHTLSLQNIKLNDPVKVRGHVTLFGGAPEDFTAQTLINVQALAAKMAIHWKSSGTTIPFASQSPSALVVKLDSDNLGNLHHVFRGGVVTNLVGLSENPTIAPNATTFGLFAIAQNRSVQVFTDFTSFESALASRLNGITKLNRIHARGSFNDNQVTLTTRGMVVRLHR